MSQWLVVFLLAAFSPPISSGAAPDKSKVDLLRSNFGKGYTDDALVELYQKVDPANEKMRDAEMLRAIANPKFPEEGRPKHFFNSLSSYYDKNGDGKFTAKELDAVLGKHIERYYELLKESQAGSGPQEELAASFRVKTWKMLQKLALLKVEIKNSKRIFWAYTKLNPAAPSQVWDKAHTISSVSEFEKQVCERSKKKPVLVKFGSTQCADCTLMEFNQGLKAFSDHNAQKLDVYKVWWGPNQPKEFDKLRLAQGAKSSPSFNLYRDGKRYDCGFGFTDEQGKGLEECLEQALISESPSGSCES